MQTGFVRFRPLWSFFALGTERWLSQMSAAGLHLKDVRLRRSLFVFEKGEPEKIRYRIGYQRCGRAAAPKAAGRNGWEICERSGRWSVYRAKGASGPDSLAGRRGLYLYNNARLCFCGAVGLLSLVGLLAGMVTAVLAGNADGRQALPRLCLCSAAVLLMMLVNFCAFLWLTGVNSRLLGDLAPETGSLRSVWGTFRQAKNGENVNKPQNSLKIAKIN